MKSMQLPQLGHFTTKPVGHTACHWRSHAGVACGDPCFTCFVRLFSQKCCKLLQLRSPMHCSLAGFQGGLLQALSKAWTPGPGGCALQTADIAATHCTSTTSRVPLLLSFVSQWVYSGACRLACVRGQVGAW
jgi:hypothetical protein